MANVSSFSGAMPVIPGGEVEVARVEKTATNYTGFATAVSSASNLFATDLTFIADGSTSYVIEFFTPRDYISYSGNHYIHLVNSSGTSLGHMAVMSTGNATSHQSQIFARRIFTPSAGTVSLNIRGQIDVGGSGTMFIGNGGADTAFPTYLRAIKIVNQNDGLKPFWTPPVVTSLPSQATEGDQVLMRYAATGGGQGLWTYNSGAWRPAGGLHMIQTKTVSAVSSVSFDNVFTSLFRDYRVVGTNLTTSGTQTVISRVRLAGADSSSAYNYAGSYVLFTSTGGNFNGSSVAQWYFATGGTSPASGFSYDIHNPAIASATTYNGTSSNFDATIYTGGVHTSTTAYDGITLLASGLTGTFSVYGYAKDTA